MTKVMKKIDYNKLVLLIYKLSSYQRDKAILLFNYAAYSLIHSGYDTLYIDRLAFDLRLFNENETDLLAFNKSQLEYQNNLQMMNRTFNHIELVKFKTSVWDVIQKGYYTASKN